MSTACHEEMWHVVVTSTAVDLAAGKANKKIATLEQL